MRNFVIPVVVGVVLLAGATFFGRQVIIKPFVDWRFRVNVEKSHEYAEQGNLRRAAQFAGAALQLQPNSIEVLRHLFDLNRRLNNPSAAPIARHLIVHLETDLDEKASLMAYLLLAKDFQGFEAAHRGLTLEAQAQPKVQWQYVLWLTASGRYSEAREVLEKLVGEAPEPRFELSLATLLLRESKTAASQSRGRNLLIRLINGGDRTTALAAARSVRKLELLANDSELSSATQACLLSHEEASADDKIFAYQLAIDENPGNRKEIIDEVEQALQGDGLVSLARWLTLNGESKRVLSLLQPDEARADIELFHICLTALMIEKRWKEAREWLDSPPAALELPRLEALRATLASRQGDKKRAADHWNRALEKSAMHSASHYFKIYQLAKAEGDGAVAIEALVRWIKSDAVESLSLAQVRLLLVFLSQAGRERDLIAVLKKLLTRDPENPLLINAMAYAQILDRYDVAQAVMQLEVLREKYPERLAYRTSLALGYLELGKVEAAQMELTRDPPIDWASASDSEKGTWAMVLAKNGLENEAKEILETIQIEKLTPKERRLFVP